MCNELKQFQCQRSQGFIQEFLRWECATVRGPPPPSLSPLPIPQQVGPLNPAKQEQVNAGNVFDRGSAPDPAEEH